MKASPADTSWFESLRRDAKLFAVVGLLSLVMGLLQPLAVAAAAPASYGFVICTTYGVGKAADGNRQHPRNAECPLCLTGHSCSFQFAPATPPLPATALQTPARERSIRAAWRQPARLSTRGDTPPSIRAPPLTA